MLKKLFVCTLLGFLTSNLSAQNCDSAAQRIAERTKKENDFIASKTEELKKTSQEVVKEKKTILKAFKKYKMHRFLVALALGFSSRYALQYAGISERAANAAGFFSAWGTLSPSSKPENSVFIALIVSLFETTPVGLAAGGGDLVGSFAGEAVDVYFDQNTSAEKASSEEK